MTFKPLEHLLSLGVDEQVAADWLALRKARKAPATLTAINRIETQAKLAGWPLGEALAECCEHGWQGFKAEWVQKRAKVIPLRSPQPENFAQKDYGTGGRL